MAATEEEAAPTLALLTGPLEPLAPHLSDESDRALAAAAYAELLAERERAGRFLADSEARLGAEDAAEEQRAPLGWALHEQLTETRDAHALAAWHAQRGRWDRLRQRLSQQTGTPTALLAMGRGEEERLRVEAALAAELAAPLCARFGAAGWPCSLRDNWELHIAASADGELVGLRSLAAAGANRLGVVRQPRAAEEAAALAAAAARARSPAARRAVAGEPMLLEGRGMRRHLRDLASAEPGPEQVGRFLAAHGQPGAAQRLLDAAAAARAAAAAEAAEAAASAHPPSASPAASEPDVVAYIRAPTLSAGEADAGIAAAAAAAPPPTLRVECRPGRLRLRAGEAGAVTLRNAGSLAVYYAWKHADSAGAEREAGAQFCEAAEGVQAALLPGGSVECRFSCAADARAREIWELVTAPGLESTVAVLLEATG